MPFNFNGTGVENVTYNGTVLGKVIYNGVVVWEGIKSNLIPILTGSSTNMGGGFTCTSHTLDIKAYNKTNYSRNFDGWWNAFDGTDTRAYNGDDNDWGAWEHYSYIDVALPKAVHFLEGLFKWRVWNYGSFVIRGQQEGTGTWYTVYTNYTSHGQSRWYTYSHSGALSHTDKKFTKLRVYTEHTGWWGNVQPIQVQITKYK